MPKAIAEDPVQMFLEALGPELLSGLVAAIAGLVGVLIAFGLQNRSTRRSSVDDAVERIQIKISEYASAMQEFQEHSNAFVTRPAGSPKPPGPARPTGFEAAVAFEILVMRTKRTERAAARKFSDLWPTVRGAKPQHAVDAAGELAGVLTAWRVGDLTDLAGVLAKIREVAAPTPKKAAPPKKAKP